MQRAPCTGHRLAARQARGQRSSCERRARARRRRREFSVAMPSNNPTLTLTVALLSSCTHNAPHKTLSFRKLRHVPYISNTCLTNFSLFL